MKQLLAAIQLIGIRLEGAWLESEMRHINRQIAKQKRIMRQADREIAARSRA